MVAKTVILLALTFGSYGLILSGWFSLWGMLGLAVFMGVGVAGLGFAVAHDALHGAYSSKAWVNKLFGYVFDLLGANGYMWKITHNVIHHTYTNITGVDEDLTVSPLLRLSPESPRLPIHRFQHLYAIAAYSTSTLFWLFAKDFKYFFAKELGPYKDKKHPPVEWVTLWVSKVFYILWAIVVPLVVLNVAWWQFLIGFLVMHLTAGAILGIVFQLAHVVEGPDFPAARQHGDDGQRLDDSRDADHGELRTEQQAAVLVRGRAQLPGRAPPLSAGLQRALPGDQPHRGRSGAGVRRAVLRAADFSGCGEITPPHAPRAGTAG